MLCDVSSHLHIHNSMSVYIFMSHSLSSCYVYLHIHEPIIKLMFNCFYSLRSMRPSLAKAIERIHLRQCCRLQAKPSRMVCYILCIVDYLRRIQGRHFNFFLGGPKFFLFFNATGLLKNWKKQHFICSNLMLFIVPFFLFSLFSLFFLFFLYFFLFFFFFFFLGGDGPPSPPQMTPLD